MDVLSAQATHLFLKSKHGSPMKSVNTLRLKVGQGIQDDINANPISPRQILLVRLEDLEELAIPPGELRENVVLSGLPSDIFRPGSLVRFQGGSSVRLTFYCEPCKRIGHLVPSFKSIEGKRGILGVIISNGELQRNGHLEVQTDAFPALPEKPFERFLLFLSKVPAGKVITYKHVIQGIGVADSYFRAIPKYLQKAAESGYPVHRVLDSEGCLIQHVVDQSDLLVSEGIEVIREFTLFGEGNKASVNLERYIWHDNTIYQM
jgi:alkylated DNA nucleotide flippase Atl1